MFTRGVVCPFVILGQVAFEASLVTSSFGGFFLSLFCFVIHKLDHTGQDGATQVAQHRQLPRFVFVTQHVLHCRLVAVQVPFAAYHLPQIVTNGLPFHLVSPHDCKLTLQFVVFHTAEFRINDLFSIVGKTIQMLSQNLLVEQASYAKAWIGRIISTYTHTLIMRVRV